MTTRSHADRVTYTTPNRRSTMRNRTITALLTAGALTLGGVVPAYATNAGTKDGSGGTACRVSWNAVGILDADGVPGLDTDLNGNPIPNYSNQGFAVEVAPVLNPDSMYSQGRFEVQHYFTGAGNTTVNFRVLVASTGGFTPGAGFTIDLPEVDGEWKATDATTWAATRYMTGQQWTNPGAVALDGTNRVTITDMPANGVVAVTFSAPIAAERARDTFTASATLTGTMADCSCTTERVLVKPAVPGTDAVYETRVVPGTDAVYETRVVPGAPAVYEDRTVPGKPAVTKTVTTPGKPASNPVVGTFQVDAYRMPARWVRGLKADGVLKFREDRAAWGKNTWEFVTIRALDVKRAGSLTKAIDAKTRKVPNLGGNTVAWRLHSTATTKAAWGPGKNKSQVLWTKVAVPAYRPATKATTKTVTVTPATPATTERVLVRPATPATTERVLVKPAVPATTERVLVRPATEGTPAVYETRTTCARELKIRE